MLPEDYPVVRNTENIISQYCIRKF